MLHCAVRSFRSHGVGTHVWDWKSVDDCLADGDAPAPARWCEEQDAGVPPNQKRLHLTLAPAVPARAPVRGLQRPASGAGQVGSVVRLVAVGAADPVPCVWRYASPVAYLWPMLDRALLLSAAAAVALAGCGADDTEPEPEPEPQPLVLASFNVGLAFGYVEEASARVDPVIAAIEASRADVICVQELWTNQDDAGAWTQEVIDRVLAGTAEAYPHQYWERTTAPEGTAPLGCTIEEAEPLEECAVEACGDVAPENLADCVLVECAAQFSATSAECQNCLAANIGSPLDEIIGACKGVFSDGIVYDGHNGLAVLSRHPLEATEHLAFDFSLTARSALHVAVTPADGDPFDAYCTHLASDLSSTLSYPEDGPYASYAEENASQASDLLAFVDDTATAETVVLLGDFNHGPGELPDNYEIMLDAGYEDPIADADVACTFCPENTLLEGADDVDDLIDHIYVRTPGSIESAQTVFDETVEVTLADGTTAQSNLSDHYGVEVELLR